MDCSLFCLFCREKASYFVNYSRVHAVCDQHTLTPIQRNTCSICGCSVTIIFYSKIQEQCSSCPKAAVTNLDINCTHKYCYSCYLEIKEYLTLTQGYCHKCVPPGKVCNHCKVQHTQTHDLDCKHVYCGDCLAKWNNECPLCSPKGFCFVCSQPVEEKLSKCTHFVCEGCYKSSRHLSKRKNCLCCMESKEVPTKKIKLIDQTEMCKNCSRKSLVPNDSSLTCFECKKKFCGYCLWPNPAINHSTRCSRIKSDEWSLERFQEWKDKLRFHNGIYCPSCLGIQVFEKTKRGSVRCKADCKKIFCLECHSLLSPERAKLHKC